MLISKLTLGLPELSHNSIDLYFHDGGNLINLINYIDPSSISEELITFDEVSDTFLALKTAREKFNIPSFIDGMSILF